jgi:hypothetical protein
LWDQNGFLRYERDLQEITGDGRSRPNHVRECPRTAKSERHAGAQTADPLYHPHQLNPSRTTMVNPASMGPPLSPREPRRSGRRSAHSHSNSTSASRSPNSPTPTESRSKEGPTSGKQSGSSTNSRNGKRSKQEDFEDGVEDSQRSVAASSVSSSSTALHGNGRTKQKGKVSVDAAASSTQPIKSNGGNSRDLSVSAPDDDEEQGITRCICESTGKSFPQLSFNSEKLIIYIEQRTTLMPESLWYSAKLAKHGNTVSAWDITAKTICPQTTITVNSVGQIFT